MHEPPFAVQIELVEGCPLRCPFCGLNGIRGKNNNYKFMDPLTTLYTLARGMSRLGWTSRIELAMHGEPSLHPQLLKCVDTIREFLANPLMITTNGAGFLRGGSEGCRRIIEDLFVAGVTTVAIDDYKHATIVPKIRRYLAGLVPEHIRVHEYPRDGRPANPHARVRAQRLIFIEDITKATTGSHSHINNHAGAGAPKNDKGEGKRCAKPFRELSVRWDGSVALCCNDWRGAYVIGNVNDMSLSQLWQHPRFRAQRRALYHGMREYGPCKGCDARSTRTGLLPDKLGKESLPMPTLNDMKNVRAALADGPLTKPVLREWEKDDE